MKKQLMHLLACLFAAALLLPAGLPASAAEIGPVVRAGLAYGSGALPGANLLNEVGTGYRLGYFDENLSFQQLAYTSETAISVVKTQNVWYGYLSSQGRNGYSDQITTDVGVGCYHVQIPGSYADFESARTTAAGIPGGFPAWIEGAYQVRVGAYLTQAEAQGAAAALGGTLVGTSQYAVSVVKTGTNDILFQFDGGSRLALGVQPGLDGGGKPVTWFAGFQYYGGFRYLRTGGNLSVINIVDLEDYINCVLSREMSNSWPLEALKAQAVCARNYAARKILASKHTGQGFDVCNTTDCQVYSGVSQTGQNTARAAAETAGQYIRYQGEIVDTYYSACDGGATEDIANVWSGGGSMPWLKGVSDPYESSVANKISGYSWSKTYTAQQLTDLLNQKGYTNTGIVSVQITPTAMGNVKSITFTDSSGSNRTFNGDNARILLRLDSNRYALSTGGTSPIIPDGGAAGGQGGYPVSGGTMDSLTGAYVINGSGSLAQIEGEPAYAITGDGLQALKPQQGGGNQPASGTGNAVTGNSFTFVGTGKGHNVGMSQWGANAMATQGLTYLDILNFYFTGITVG